MTNAVSKEAATAAAAAARPIILACGCMWMERLIVSQPAGQLVLYACKGDAGRTASYMAIINSVQAILKLVIAPVVGSMSDKVVASYIASRMSLISIIFCVDWPSPFLTVCAPAVGANTYGCGSQPVRAHRYCVL